MEIAHRHIITRRAAALCLPPLAHGASDTKTVPAAVASENAPSFSSNRERSAKFFVSPAKTLRIREVSRAREFAKDSDERVLACAQASAIRGGPHVARRHAAVPHALQLRVALDDWVRNDVHERARA